MKKNIMFSALIMTLILAPFSISLAQELTLAQARQLAPSLSQAVSSLNVILQNELARRNMERSALANLSPILSSAASQVRQSGSSLTQSQLDAISVQLTSVQNTVTSVVNRRNTFEDSLDSIVEILSEIADAISTARS